MVYLLKLKHHSFDAPVGSIDIMIVQESWRWRLVLLITNTAPHMLTSDFVGLVESPSQSLFWMD
jgi:hypothetical protein